MLGKKKVKEKKRSGECGRRRKKKPTRAMGRLGGPPPEWQMERAWAHWGGGGRGLARACLGLLGLRGAATRVLGAR